MKQGVIGLGLITGFLLVMGFALKAVLPEKENIQVSYEFNADKLVSEFERNEDFASKKYYDQWVKVTGALSEIDVTSEGLTILKLQNASNDTSIQCKIKGVIKSNQLDELHLNKSMTIVGRCQGKSRDIVLEECEII